MNSYIGYYPVFDMFLALRQNYSDERFRPFNGEMSFIEEHLEDENLKSLGIITNGYLKGIEKLIELKLKTLESGDSLLIDFIDNLKLSFIDNSNTINDEEIYSSYCELIDKYNIDSSFQNDLKNVIKNLWIKVFSTNYNKYNTNIFESISSLKHIKKDKIINFLSDVSDRIEISNGYLTFNVEPAFSIELNKIENIIILPSIYATRNLTFWYSGNNIVFYLAIKKNKIELTEPSDMVLLSTSALNDKTRLKILRYISNKKCTASELAVYFDMNASTISRHLKLFKDVGFIKICSQDKNSIIYEINELKINKALLNIKKFILVE